MGRQLSLSFELILLFKWFLKNGKNKLRLLIREAVDAGLAEKLEKLDDRDYADMVLTMHDDVLDFVLFLEDELWDELERKDVSISRVIDKEMLDEKMLLLGATRVKSGALVDEKKEELLKKLLQSWKPESGETIN